MSALSLLQNLAGQKLVRRAADALLVRQARRRVARLEQLDVAAIQRRTLLRLVRQARSTRFGRHHDFASIRSLEDYRRAVPLRDYEAFWSEYWKPAYPWLENVTWPGVIPYLALSSGTTSGSTKYIPVSGRMLASNRQAALTSLAFYQAHYRDLTLFHGRIFFLGGSTDLQDLGASIGRPGQVLGGDLSGIAAREVHPLLRPYTFPPLDLALLRDWEAKMQRLVELSLPLPITLVSGVPSWLLLLFERLLQVSGKANLAEAWPSLQLIVHGGTRFDPYRDLFRQLAGSERIRFLETYPASEGFVASEDPRHGLLRVLPDHDIFFEFVPVAELKNTQPTRHALHEIVPGVQYAVVLTTCAGLWSYVLGDTVCFERRQPPLLRFTGRTRYFLSAFGEHLISEEVEKAITAASTATGVSAIDFHVGPVFPDRPGMVGRHRYLVEFAGSVPDLSTFARVLDEELCQLNEDYAAHRAGDLTMRAPEVLAVQRGGFARWMRSQGKLGGQHKVPRMDSTGALTRQIEEWMRQNGLMPSSLRDPATCP